MALVIELTSEKAAEREAERQRLTNAHEVAQAAVLAEGRRHVALGNMVSDGDLAALEWLVKQEKRAQVALELWEGRY